MNINKFLGDLSQATLALRDRSSSREVEDGIFAFACEAGKVQLQLVKLDAAERIILPVSPWLTPRAALDFVRGYEPDHRNFSSLVEPLQEIQKRHPFGSPEHRDAYDCIRLAVRVFKGSDIGNYE